MSTATESRSTNEKVALFRRFFTGLKEVYGTYDPQSGRARQVKAPVTDQIILAHLRGMQPYGVYLLVGDRTRAVAVDFDDEDLNPPIEWVSAAHHYGISAYIERSKSKGYHVWVFFTEPGVLAWKARVVMRHILTEIGRPHTEVFPKQDTLGAGVSFGNFIYAPLFGLLVPKGRTVFLDPNDPSKPAPDQWGLLEQVRTVGEEILDDIIAVNDLTAGPVESPATGPSEGAPRTLGIPPCAQRLLAEGVRENQRVSCFRLAVDLKRAGLPYDLAVAALMSWSLKNRPLNGKRIITPSEIVAQAESAYQRDYRGCGCEEPAVQVFCDPVCPVRTRWPAGQERDSTT